VPRRTPHAAPDWLSAQLGLEPGSVIHAAPPQQSRLLAKAIARSRFILLSRVAHMTPLERPREVNQALFNFYLDN